MLISLKCTDQTDVNHKVLRQLALLLFELPFLDLFGPCCALGSNSSVCVEWLMFFDLLMKRHGLRTKTKDSKCNTCIQAAKGPDFAGVHFDTLGKANFIIHLLPCSGFNIPKKVVQTCQRPETNAQSFACSGQIRSSGCVSVMLDCLAELVRVETSANHHPPKNIIFVCKQQRRLITPPHPPPHPP